MKQHFLFSQASDPKSKQASTSTLSGATASKDISKTKISMFEKHKNAQKLFTENRKIKIKKYSE